MSVGTWNVQSYARKIIDKLDRIKKLDTGITLLREAKKNGSGLEK